MSNLLCVWGGGQEGWGKEQKLCLPMTWEQRKLWRWSRRHLALWTSTRATECPLAFVSPEILKRKREVRIYSHPQRVCSLPPPSPRVSAPT